jgi:hypothetical protein
MEQAKKNKWVAFLSKVAFICNLCFLLGIVIRYTHDFIGNQTLKGTVVILGTFASLLFNCILQAGMLLLRAGKKEIPVSPWLRVFNVVVFALQVIFYFLLPGD